MKTPNGFSGIAFIIIFLAICLSPWIDTVFRVDTSPALSENRQLAVIPKLPADATAFNRFPADLNDFFNDHFGFRRVLLQTHGRIMVQILKTSPNPQVILGSDHWLFFEPDIRYLTSFNDGGFIQANGSSTQADTVFIEKKSSPLKAIIDFDRQLRDRNIRLVLLPVPVKPMLYAEKITPQFDNPYGYLQNPAYAQFMTELERENIPVMDLSAVLAELKKTSKNPIFLRTDTHWRPETVTAVAKSIASYIEAHADLSLRYSGELEMREMEIVNTGDLANMLLVTRDSNSEFAEKATVKQIVSNGNAPWASDRNAEILFLGDSFANIYSLGAMGWGESAGLVEQLSYFLNRPVDRIVQNDNGAFATRQALQEELARGRDRLKNKKVVVWEFAVRELVTGDWKMLDMKLNESKGGGFFTPASGKEVVATGTIYDVSSRPIPGTTPYKDHIMSFHLVDVTIDDGANAHYDALVYAFSMKDNKLTDAAHYRVGQKITMRLKNWYDVNGKYDSINRSEIDDEELLFADPCWAEEIIQ
jgi:hypothetical protein